MLTVGVSPGLGARASPFGGAVRSHGELRPLPSGKDRFLRPPQSEKSGPKLHRSAEQPRSVPATGSERGGTASVPSEQS